MLKDIPNDETGFALKNIIYSGKVELTKPMEIDFFVAVPSLEQGLLLEKRVKELGFNTSVEQDEIGSTWTCYCQKFMFLDYYKIVEIENMLNTISKEYNGYIDGFGTFGNLQ